MIYTYIYIYDLMDYLDIYLSEKRKTKTNNLIKITIN